MKSNSTRYSNKESNPDEGSERSGVYLLNDDKGWRLGNGKDSSEVASLNRTGHHSERDGLVG